MPSVDQLLAWRHRWVLDLVGLVGGVAFIIWFFVAIKHGG